MAGRNTTGRSATSLRIVSPTCAVGLQPAVGGGDGQVLAIRTECGERPAVRSRLWWHEIKLQKDMLHSWLALKSSRPCSSCRKCVTRACDGWRASSTCRPDCSCTHVLRRSRLHQDALKATADLQPAPRKQFACGGLHSGHPVANGLALTSKLITNLVLGSSHVCRLAL